MKDWILKFCFTKAGGLNNRVTIDSWWENKGFCDEKAKIVEETSWLPESVCVSQRIYHIVNEHKNVGVCEVCANPTNFRQFKSGYRQYCSQYCVTQSESRNAKIGNHPNHVNSRLKAYETMKERNGGVHPMNDPEHQLHLQQAKLTKYGSTQAASNQEKRRATCLKLYGVDHVSKTEEWKTSFSLAQAERFEKEGHFRNFFGSESQAEKDVRAFLTETSGFEFKKTRKLLGNGKEVDGYCKEKNLAFEYCGLYWHSEKTVEPDRVRNLHFDKFIRCRELGVELVTIFEDEWLFRRAQVEGFLRAKLGVFESKIFARSCKLIENSKPKEFFDANHIQGHARGIYDVSLEFEGEIVCAMSFGYHHRDGVKQIVLNRYAAKAGVMVVGGAERLFSHAVKFLGPDIVTWSDNRWTDGKFYERLGFVKEQEGRPEYSYYVNHTKILRIPKQSFTKEKSGCPDGMTEHQWALENKLYRIYDCGKIKWRFKD